MGQGLEKQRSPKQPCLNINWLQDPRPDNNVGQNSVEKFANFRFFGKLRKSKII